jgi:hypothetical protein
MEGLGERGGSFSWVDSQNGEVAVAAVATTVAGSVCAEAIVPIIEAVSSYGR